MAKITKKEIKKVTLTPNVNESGVEEVSVEETKEVSKEMSVIETILYKVDKVIENVYHTDNGRKTVTRNEIEAILNSVLK